MNAVPEPLTARECDLQDFPFMPLHVARLRDSDLAAEEDPEACWYAVLLWAAAWHQLPAGSLPDNDTVLCKLIGLGRDLKTFRKHRNGALRGFIKCSDGRLYHPVVAEQVRDAWKSKLEQRWRTECSRIRKANQRNGTEHPQPTFEEFVARDKADAVTGLSHGTSPNVPSDIASNRQGQGQGQGQGIEEKSSEPNGSAPDAPIADPPLDPEKVMFDSGKRLLADAGIPPSRAGPILGKWKREHGAEAVIVALGKAQREGAIDPVSFIEGCFRNGGSNGNRSGRADGLGRTAAAALAVFGPLERGDAADEPPRPRQLGLGGS
jgi:hypothetical protein